MLKIGRVVCALAIGALAALGGACKAQPGAQVLDIGTRPGVTQRVLVAAPPQPKAVAVLFAGGHGGLQIADGGSLRWGEGNFLVRTRALLAGRGVVTVLVDSPSDRQRPPFLDGFRTSPEHVADIAAVIAAMRKQYGLPVWLVGTSRGTQSVAYAATRLRGPDAPDGIVLTSTILSDRFSLAVPDMALDQVAVPTMVVHHANDQCRVCLPADLPRLASALGRAPRFQLQMISGGISVGNVCGGSAHHGFNGVEDQTIEAIAAWMLGR